MKNCECQQTSASSRENLALVQFSVILYVPSTIFQLNRDGSSWVELGLSYDKFVLLKDHNAVMPVRLEPTALQSRVKHSTTEPPRSLSASEHIGESSNFQDPEFSKFKS